MKSPARLLAVVVTLAACTDLPNEPSAPRAPALPSAASPAAQGGGGKSALELIEADYASGLLDRNNANLYREQAVSAPGRLPAKYRSAARGKDATYSLVLLAREWGTLSKATQDEILDLRADGLGNLSESIETPHFVLHYTTGGNHAVPAIDDNENGIPDYIEIAAESWEHVWQREIVELRYPSPIGTPAQKLHVYYRDIPYYGATYVENLVLETTTPVALGTASGYFVIENDFVGFPPNDEDVTGLEPIRSGALKVTQAHEFMHAVQFAINVYQSGWLMESHATWAEDIVYDGLNDWHWYINRFLATPDLPLFSRFVYGAAFFQHWLSETYGVDSPRQVWLAARTNTTANAIRTTVFGGGWEPITAFGVVEYTLGLSDFTTDGQSIIPTPSNVIRATHTSFPVVVTVGPSTNKASNRAPWGLGANFIEFVPSESGTLTLQFDGTDGFAWRAVVIATPAKGKGAPSVIPISLNAASVGSVSISGFGTKYQKVTLVPTIAGTDGSAVPYSYGADVK
jgi:hypothetical protein